MLRRPLLALFRGPDGRSLALSLAIIVLVNVMLAGLHGGALAYTATTDTPTVCTSIGGNSDPAHPANDVDHRAYDIVGTVSAVASVVPPSSPALADAPPALRVAGVHRRCRPAMPTPDPLDSPANPRGPPLLG